jgi:hypothetical protein
LTGGAAAAVLAGARLRADTSRASCYGAAMGPVRCVTGFPTVDAIPPQSCRALCWASCLAYMLQGYGADVAVPQVLARYRLDGGCRADDDRVRLLQAAGTWTDARDRPFLVQVTELGSLHERYPAGASVLAVFDRMARQPMLCGAAGHTTLITEIETSDMVLSPLRRERITVADPYTGTVRDLTEDELSRPFWVLGLSVRAL